MTVSHDIDRISVTFDEPNLVANAGLLLVATVAERLGLERLVDASLRLAGRAGGAHPGRKTMTLLHAMVAGATHIDHADLLRAGATEAVLGHRVMAPSTLGTFLRSFTFGHVRQLDAVLSEAIARAWAVMGVPDELIVDIDSTICEVCGPKKQGAAFGYTKVRCYHPILATRADTGEILHVRLRKGSANTQRGVVRFVEELIARLRRAGACGKLVFRFDSGFFNEDLAETLEVHGVSYTMGVRMVKPLAEAIAQIDEWAWEPIGDYPVTGVAEVAELTYKERRLIIRRTCSDEPQGVLFYHWRHFGFLTNLNGDLLEVDRFHRAHAVCELAIRDLKEGVGLAHLPSGKFWANSAWLVLAAIAHNLLRWTASLGGMIDANQLVVAATMRTSVVSMPGRLVNRAGRSILRAPIAWPWADDIRRALQRIRCLRPVPV